VHNRILLGLVLAAVLITLVFDLLGAGDQPEPEVTLQQIHEDLLTISQHLQHLENLGKIAGALSQISRELRFGLDVDCQCECDCEP